MWKQVAIFNLVSFQILNCIIICRHKLFVISHFSLHTVSYLSARMDGCVTVSNQIKHIRVLSLLVWEIDEQVRNSFPTKRRDHVFWIYRWLTSWYSIRHCWRLNLKKLFENSPHSVRYSTVEYFRCCTLAQRPTQTKRSHHYWKKIR